MRRLIDFLKAVHSKGTDESSKRMYGGIGFMMAAVTIVAVERALLKDLLFVSAALLGLGLMDNFFKR